MNPAADAYCDAVLAHYENFTVASRLAPRALRRDLARLYAFARTTDDLGDESGDPAVATRRLIAWRTEVTGLFAGEVVLHPVLLALRDTIERHALPSQPFMDLIEANLQDQRIATYEDWPALLEYCRLSAAPVGRLVLRLFGVTDSRSIPLSDDVCIGLQLANFAQDVSVDGRRGRTYLMQCDLRDLGEAGAVRAMCVRARTLLASGRELEAMVAPRLRLQLALYRLGGEAILDTIARTNYKTAAARPTVSTRARARIGLTSVFTIVHGRTRPSPIPLESDG
jgi:squalene synthase HpnC